MKLKDKVIINPESEYKHQSGGTIGEIVAPYSLQPSEFKWEVVWKDGDRNSYRPADLILVEEYEDTPLIFN